MSQATIKPRLRGASHRLAFFAAPVAGAALLGLAAAHSGRALVACSAYVVTLIALFGISAGYHRSKGRPQVIARWRRADHSTIFLMIAGTYTPLCLLGVTGAAGIELLVLVWAGALLGVLRATLWTYAPRGVSALLYVALGWLMVAYFEEVRAGIGDVLLAMILLGGLLYTLGAVIYALRRPNPAPTVFGYHEIFHLLVIAAAGCHFAVVVQLTRAA